MSCQSIKDQFDERLNGIPSPAFEVHLSGCADCRREWEAYAGLWRVLGRDKGIEPSFGFAERTLRRLNEPEVGIRRWFWQPALRWTALAATVCVVVVGGWIGHERAVARKRAEIYARAQQADYLEDYDVIASLDQLHGDNHL
jgi:hypothetical protein